MDRFPTAFLAFGQTEIVLPGALAVHLGFLLPYRFTQLVHCFLPCLIEQIDVLEIGNIRGAAGGIQNQRPTVGWIVPVIRIILGLNSTAHDIVLLLWPFFAETISASIATQLRDTTYSIKAVI